MMSLLFAASPLITRWRTIWQCCNMCDQY